MRSKDTGASVATAFMAEPTTAINMLYNAAYGKLEAGESRKAAVGKALGAFLSSVALNSALKSLVNLLANQSACCCETKQLIMQSNYDGAMRDAATNANITAQIQSVKDMIAQDKIEALRDRIGTLELNQAVAGVVKYPTATTYTSGGNPFCGCGCNF